MTGMLGVGIGEVVVPQLVKKNDVPVPIAAGTSVLVVFFNAVGESVGFAHCMSAICPASLLSLMLDVYGIGTKEQILTPRDAVVMNARRCCTLLPLRASDSRD